MRRVPSGGAGRAGGLSGAGWLGFSQGGGGEGHGSLCQGERSPLNAEAEAGAGTKGNDVAVTGLWAEVSARRCRGVQGERSPL